MGSVFDERFAAERIEGSEDSFEHLREITSLLRLGAIEDSFELYGHSFLMRTLTVEEEIAVDDLLFSKFASSYNEMALKAAWVAASLELLDGEPLSKSLGLSETSELSRGFDRIKKWYRPIVDKLYERYVALSQRQQEALEELEKKGVTSLSPPVALSDSLIDKGSSTEA